MFRGYLGSQLDLTGDPLTANPVAGSVTVAGDAIAVPEPSTLLLLTAGLALFGVVRGEARRRE